VQETSHSQHDKQVFVKTKVPEVDKLVLAAAVCTGGFHFWEK
jgi:hypothetical protein